MCVYVYVFVFKVWLRSKPHRAPTPVSYFNAAFSAGGQRRGLGGRKKLVKQLVEGEGLGCQGMEGEAGGN